MNKESGGPSLVTDANQRIITNIDIVNTSVPGQVVPKRIVCAEPSPDVAVAFSEAIQASVAASEGGTSGSANFGASTSQSVAQLGERLATVQLLRDMAYRNCEAYANGSINATSYTILNSRLNKTIVTLLSSEMMAGAFGRNLAVILSSATSEGEAKTSSPEDDSDEGSEGEADASTSVTTSAAGKSAGSDAVGNIEGQEQRSSDNVATQLAQMHRTFIEDNSFVTLIDACVAHMNNIPVSSKEIPNGAETQSSEAETQTQIVVAEAQAQVAENSPFTTICVGLVLPKAVELAEMETAREAELQRLQIIWNIIDAVEKIMVRTLRAA